MTRSRRINDLLAMNDEILNVNCQFRDEAETPAPHTSVVITAYTTAQISLKLYKYFGKLGNRLLCYDTDSFIFISYIDTPYEYQPFIGSKLGNITDELCGYGKNTYIDNFISCRPK